MSRGSIEVINFTGGMESALKIPEASAIAHTNCELVMTHPLALGSKGPRTMYKHEIEILGEHASQLVGVERRAHGPCQSHNRTS